MQMYPLLPKSQKLLNPRGWLVEHHYEPKGHHQGAGAVDKLGWWTRRGRVVDTKRIQTAVVVEGSGATSVRDSQSLGKPVVPRVVALHIV